MQAKVFKKEFDKMFEWFTTGTDNGKLQMEAEFYKKLFGFFLAGDSYYFVMNHNTMSIEFVSDEVKEVLGYSADEFTIALLNSSLHPDDQPWFLTFGQRIIDFFSQLPIDKLMKYKLRYDIRYKKKDGEYVRILYQGIIIEHDTSGRPSRSLAVHSDITYLKHEGKPVLSFMGMDGEPSYVDTGSKNMFIATKDELTSREKQILKLLAQGKLSKEISSLLNISKQTVDTHRKNMLQKKSLKNTGELIGKAIRYGWI